MKRVALAVIVLLAMFWPAIWNGAGSASGVDTASISDYRVSYRVAADGTLSAVETLTTVMPYGKHGIFRFWDVRDAADSHVRLRPEHIAVSMDDAPEPFRTYDDGNRRYVVAKIGDPKVILSPGLHVYRISYDIPGALLPGADANHSLFYWTVIPAGWQMDIGHAEIRLHLPAAARDLHCGVGLGQDLRSCQLRGNGSRNLVIHTAALPPHTPVTVQTTLAVPTPAQVRLPWPGRFDGVLGGSVLVPLVLLVLAVLAGLAGALVASRAKEQDPGLPLGYAPPPGVGPVQSAYVVTEAVPPQAMTATLLYQAEQKLTTLTVTNAGAWVVQGLGTPDQWAATDPVTRGLGEAVGVTVVGGTFTADGSVESGKLLQSAKATVDSETRAWAKQAGLIEPIPLASLGRALVYVALLLTGYLLIATPFDVSMLGLPPASYLIFGLPLLAPGSTTRRTAQGRDLWSRAGGFRRILSTPSSEARFDFSGRNDLYTAFIPWAVAFGCAREWEQKYVTETNQPAPTPLWMYGAAGYYSTGGSSLASIDSFESSLSSSISAYQATQTSSSSGGGFSGGGGGGGGGGGSW